MKLQHLRCLCTVVDESFNMSRAARVLHASQPGVSKQIRLLEEALKVDVLLRRGGRIMGLTAAGESVVAIGRQMLRDAESLRRVGDDVANRDSGQLVLATTHLHARYVLLDVVKNFRKRYPSVQLVLRQGSPEKIVELLTRAEADIGIANEVPAREPPLVELPCGKLTRCVVAPRGHPLTRLPRLTLRQIARYPIITLERSSPGGRAVARAFASHGIEPNVVMQAIDTDVAKAYVELGLGIAIMPAVAVDPKRDSALTSLEATHLFGFGTMMAVIDPRSYMRAYMYDFIHMLSPSWTRERIDAAFRTRS